VTTFSVIIPTYNCEEFVEESIRSVLNQSYQDFEVLVVDNNSTDDTVAKVEAICDRRITLLCEVQQGAAAARNTGISHAKGDYIAFLDGDDVWLPHKLDYHRAHFEAYPDAAVSFSWTVTMRKDGTCITSSFNPPAERINPVDPLWLLWSTPLRCGSTAVFKASALRDIARPPGQWFDTGFVLGEDTELCFQIVARGHQVRGIPEPLVAYRIRSRSTTSQSRYLSQLVDLQERFFTLMPHLFTRYAHQTAEAFHHRYRAQISLLRGGQRLEAVSCMIRALLSSPAILVKDPSITTVTMAVSIMRVFIGERCTHAFIMRGGQVWSGLISQFDAARQRIDISSLQRDCADSQFSVIIPVGRRTDTLVQVLASVRGLSQREKLIREVIIVDNRASRDGSLVAEHEFQALSNSEFSFDIIEEPAFEAGAARQAGASKARADWLLFVDDDVVLDPEFAVNAARYLCAEPEISAMNGPIFGASDPSATAEPAGTSEFLDFQCKIARPKDCFSLKHLQLLPVAAFVAKRSTWSHVVHEKQRLLSAPGESIEALALLTRGGSVRYNPGMRATHLLPQARLSISRGGIIAFGSGLKVTYLNSLSGSMLRGVLLHVVAPWRGCAWISRQLVLLLSSQGMDRRALFIRACFGVGISLSSLFTLYKLVRGRWRCR